MTTTERVTDTVTGETTSVTYDDKGWAVDVQPDEADEGLVWMLHVDNRYLPMGAVTHVEFFSTRPRTPGVGGDPDGWPARYEVWEGYINGGDAMVIERDGEALA